jgi:hypothetical protein
MQAVTLTEFNFMATPNMRATDQRPSDPHDGGDQRGSPKWAIKEDERARAENRGDHAEGRYYLRLAIGGAAMIAASALWRLVA